MTVITERMTTSLTQESMLFIGLMYRNGATGVADSSAASASSSWRAREATDVRGSDVAVTGGPMGPKLMGA